MLIFQPAFWTLYGVACKCKSVGVIFYKCRIFLGKYIDRFYLVKL